MTKPTFDMDAAIKALCEGKDLTGKDGIHQIHNSLKYIASKNQKALMADLECVYKAATLNAADSALGELEAKWGDKYPMVISLGAASGRRCQPTLNTRIMCAPRYTSPMPSWRFIGSTAS